jgi:uncharacterized protein
MRMSDGERLIAVMLAEVMEALKLNNEIDPTLVKTLVINNDGWALKRKYSGLFTSEAPADHVVSETTNILWMWGIIEHSIAKLTGAEAAEAKGWHWAKFDGFDGNNDDHYGVAHTMIEDLEEFQDFKGRNLNSHTRSSLPRYLAMYEKFERYLNAGKASPLNIDALRDLCS